VIRAGATQLEQLTHRCKSGLVHVINVVLVVVVVSGCGGSSSSGPDAGPGDADGADAAVDCVDRTAPGCQPVGLATTPGFPHALVVSATHVYFTERSGTSGSRLLRVAIAGGAVEELAMLGSSASAVVLDGTSAYVAMLADSQIVRVPQTGGTPVDLISGGTVSGPTSLVIRGSTIYFNNLNGSSLSSIPLAGGNAVNVAAASAMTQSLELCGDAICAAAYTTPGRVTRTPLTGAGAGTPMDLATAQGNPFSIATSATHVYFSNYGSGEIKRVAIAGGAPEPIASGLDLPTGIYVDDTHVYWTNFAEATQNGPAVGSVQRAPIAGGPSETLAADQDGPYDIAGDATAVYWTNRWGGTVMKIAK
jgi:hypothetical protein